VSAGGGMWRALRDLGRLGRPLHLAGGALFYAIGAAAAAAEGAPARRDIALAGLLAALCAQLLTHYSNDYFDLDTDRLNQHPTRWSGGSRVLVEGALAPATALWAALACGAASLGLAAWAAARSPEPWVSLGLALLGLALAWSYSAPPLRLNRWGAGEITGALLVPGLTALYGYQLQTGGGLSPQLLAVVPLCLFQFAMLVAVNLPDVESDAAVGKRTLVVRLGRPRAAALYIGAVAAAFVSLPLLSLLGLSRLVGLAALGAAPIALGLFVALWRGAWLRPTAWEALGFWSIGLLMAGGACIFGALLV
jgi:1,4-dihydroxy-2-naphthoate octaprenyltransferase